MLDKSNDFNAAVAAQDILRHAYDQLRCAYASGCDTDVNSLKTVQYAIEYIWCVYYGEDKPTK